MGTVRLTAEEYSNLANATWADDDLYFHGERPPDITDQLVRRTLRIVALPKNEMLSFDMERGRIKWAVNTGRRLYDNLGHTDLRCNELPNPTRAWISPFSGRTVLAELPELQVPPLSYPVVVHRRGHLYLLLAKGKPLWAVEEN